MKMQTMGRLTGATAVVVALATGPSMPVRAGQFLHMVGSEINTHFANKMLTDDTHWRETYLPGGRLLAEQMGGAPMTGTRRIDHEQLCTNLPGVRDACYSVWQSGDRLELRHAGYPPVEHFFGRPIRPSPAEGRSVAAPNTIPMAQLICLTGVIMQFAFGHML